jgi:hypothetical protein
MSTSPNIVPARDWIDYDYALVRVVPHVHLGLFYNIGVVLHARTAGFLDAHLHLHRDRLARRCPTLDMDLLDRFLSAYQRICEGDTDAAPIALLPPSERFHWLTTPRSAVLQSSDVHAGRTRDPAATLEQLFSEYVQSG